MTRMLFRPAILLALSVSSIILSISVLSVSVKHRSSFFSWTWLEVSGSLRHWPKFTSSAFLRTTLSKSTGVSFQRKITEFPSSSKLSVEFVDTKKCSSSDGFGNNNCHYDWDDHVVVDYSVFVNETLTEEAFLHGTFKVRMNCTRKNCDDKVKAKKAYRSSL